MVLKSSAGCAFLTSTKFDFNLYSLAPSSRLLSVPEIQVIITSYEVKND
ncbi:hypothetical protein IMCC14465_06160 [alpha proteobacterium IMCC14465]|uniref:Uncharacterized protein n=1 Tax=alpha proteobacterium IMCC14465 TaxID=1220535 RepID=J9A387_9PROT|nr:hypothetical protein IMCC14465_06160 [alpha proteobacterium IMCC14465]